MLQEAVAAVVPLMEVSVVAAGDDSRTIYCIFRPENIDTLIFCLTPNIFEYRFNLQPLLLICSELIQSINF